MDLDFSEYHIPHKKLRKKGHEFEKAQTGGHGKGWEQKEEKGRNDTMTF